MSRTLHSAHISHHSLAPFVQGKYIEAKPCRPLPFLHSFKIVVSNNWIFGDRVGCLHRSGRAIGPGYEVPSAHLAGVFR